MCFFIATVLQRFTVCCSLLVIDQAGSVIQTLIAFLCMAKSKKRTEHVILSWPEFFKNCIFDV